MSFKYTTFIFILLIVCYFASFTVHFLSDSGKSADNNLNVGSVYEKQVSKVNVSPIKAETDKSLSVVTDSKAVDFTDKAVESLPLFFHQLAEKKDIDAAATTLENALWNGARDKATLGYYTNLALFGVSQNRVRTFMFNLSKQDQNSPELQLAMGKLELESGNYDSAAEYFHQSTQRSARSLESLLFLTNSLIGSHRLVEAGENLSRIEEILSETSEEQSESYKEYVNLAKNQVKFFNDTDE